MKSYIVFCLICMLPKSISAQVACTPTTAPGSVANVTSNSVILQLPNCCFNNITGVTCNPNTCQIWLVASLDTATGTFDADQSNPGFLSLSPYPSAFLNNSSKNYFLTFAGFLSALPCPSSTKNNFKVGKDGQCSTANCNGVLPVGAVTRFKYLLVDAANTKLLAETQWSDSIALYTPKTPGTGDGFAGRSGAMVVITAILSTAIGLLLLLLLIGCLLVTCSSGKTKEQISTFRESFRIPRYDTHNLKNPSPYDNLAYERDTKYTTDATLPKTAAMTVVVVPSDADNIKMQNI